MPMLGARCSPCCGGCGCKDCKTGTLPESVTLTIDGFEDGVTPGRFICPLEFSACYGSGAEARVTAPGGNADTDKGPISKVQVTKGGSGYAKIGRVAPTVTVSSVSGSGTGATFDVTLASSQDSCGLDRWAVSKVERTGGTGYQTGDTLTFAIAEGDTQEVAAAATIGGTTYAEPTLTATAPGGTGGVLSISGYTKLVGGYYAVTGITVASGGSGYTDNAQVTLSLGTDDEWAPGSGSPTIRIRTVIDQPADEWTLTPYSSNGSGLVVSLTLAIVDFGEEGYAPGYGPIYEATAATVVDGGADYEVGTEIAVEGSTTVEGNPTVVVVTSVDGDGAVTGLSVLFGGYHEGTDTGVISSVVITSGRPARKAITEDVSVSDGGVYYREDASLPPYVATVTVTVTQSLPSAGTGASLSVEIDDDPASETFGQITGVNIDNGGDGYLAYEWCESLLQGLTVVLPRREVYVGGQDETCFDYYKEDCYRTFRVDYRGPCLPPRVILTSPCYNESSAVGNDGLQYALFDLFASENIADCSQLSFTASDSAGRSVTVTPGGVPTEVSCSTCAGHVLVNGVQVPLAVFGNGHFTLVSVDPGPTIATAPGSGLQQLWRMYAVAQAVNLGCGMWRDEVEILIRLNFWIFGYYFSGYNIQWQGSEIMAQYDALTVGSLRANDPLFADWNITFSQTFGGAIGWGPAAYEDRLLGKIRGSACIGQDWYFYGGFDAGSITSPLPGFPPIPQPPSMVIASKDTRQTERGVIQCGPI